MGIFNWFKKKNAEETAKPKPVAQPVAQPVARPAVQPVPRPAARPAAQPTPQPTAKPEPQPVVPKKEETQTSAQLDMLLEKNRVSCDFTVEQQRRWLTVLNQTISSILLGGNPLCIDYELEPRKLAEAGNMLNTVGRIAFAVGKMLSVTNLERALHTDSQENLIQTWCILDAYAQMLQAPYCDPINKARDHIYGVLEKKNREPVREAATGGEQPAAKEEKLSLFWAPAIYDGDPLVLNAPDYEVHAFPDAAVRIVKGEKIPCESGFPAGYQFAQKSSGRVLHLRTVRNPQTGLEMVPLFTDLNLMLKMFTPNIRVSIVDFATARRFALQDRHTCAGMIINPGRDNVGLTAAQLDVITESPVVSKD